jgi:type VI secretion system secreted protein VgrG
MENDFFDFMALAKELVTSNRPIRLRLDLPDGVNDDMLLPQRVFGSETMCGSIEYRVLCVSASVDLPLKNMIAVAAELQFVTDRGDLRSVCGIITEVSSGDSDGGLASYQLVLRDALAVLEKRINTRVFRSMDEVEIVQRMLNEWRHKSPTLGISFKHEVDDAFGLHPYPKREFTMQHNESDAAFIRRLLKRRGIGWYFRSYGSCGSPIHSMVLFNRADSFRENAAGTVRYHRDAATEERDSITSWNAVRSLQAGVVTRHSWDYRNPQGRDFMSAELGSDADQGASGNELAASIDDYQVMTPHAGDDNEDLCRLGQVSMQRHDYESKCFHGEGSVRDLCAGEYFTLSEHPEVDGHSDEERDFIVTALQVTAQNNLPKALAARVERLFTRSCWMASAQEQLLQRDVTDRVTNGPLRMHVQFTAVRRGVRIVSSYDARTDLPHAHMQSAIVVGPKSEEVHCDELGRVKIRFPGTRTVDHEAGAGASDTQADSAWVRVASNWAGNGPGSLQQCGTIGLPRIGTEVLIAFLGGDPDKPIIVGQLYNQNAQPAALNPIGNLPGNRYLSGIKSREIKGGRANQLALDDTEGQISAQLASDHGDTQLNLGFLTEPKEHGYGKPRGEGAELRSNEQIALRAVKGVLLSAWQLVGNNDKQMSRNQLLDLLSDCAELAKSLGDYASEHQGRPTEHTEQEQLREALVSWEGGSGTEPKGSNGGKPVIAVTAPDGIGFATAKAVVSYAGTHLETIAQQNLQMAAGQNAVLNAGKGISLFAQGDGIDIIAHQGKLLLQSQNGETELNAAKDIKLTATEGKVICMANEIVLIAADGSFIKIGNGITLGTNGSVTHHGASFPFKGPSTMKAVLPGFSKGKADLKFQARYYANKDGGIPAPDLEIVSKVGDGSEQQERSDADGKSQLIERDGMHTVAAQVIKPAER